MKQDPSVDQSLNETQFSEMPHLRPQYSDKSSTIKSVRFGGIGEFVDGFNFQ